MRLYLVSPPLSCIEKPKSEHSTPGVASPVLGRGAGSLSMGSSLSNAALGITHHLWCQDRLLARVQLGAHQEPQALFCQAAFQLDCPEHMLVFGVVPPQEQDFALC